MQLAEITKKVYSQFNHYRPLSEYQERDIRHMKRTAAISSDIAYEMKRKYEIYDSMLTEEYIKKLQLAASHHDYMKMIWPDMMRDKKREKLMDWHLKIIENHTVCSRKNLENDLTLNNPELLEYFDDDVYDIILHHHENHDGSGYPKRLIREYIPTGAKILHVADAYDAMRSKREYRSKKYQRMTHEKTVEVILSKREIEFHPDVVDAFMDISGRNNFNDLYDYLIRLKEKKEHLNSLN